MLLLLLPTTIIKMKVDQDQLNYEDNNEDSSYDSDNEVTHSSHPSVSRNVSETLGQELCDDYNSVSIFLMIFFSLLSFIQFRHHRRRRSYTGSLEMLNCCCYF